MRVFFGLELEPETRQRIAAWRDRQLTATARPVPMANFHITLAFIGEIGEQDLERLCLRVDDWPLQQRPGGCELRLEDVGYWPRPGIFWYGPRRCPRPLTELAEKLRNLATRAGGRREKRPFQPHITLYRRCDIPPPAPPAIPALNIQCRHFTLFESRQGRTGISYHPLASWQLP